MPRTKKRAQDRDVDVFVGGQVAKFRQEMPWGLEALASRLQISAAHLKSLESGRYSFSAGMLCRVAAALDRPVSALLPPVTRVRPEGTPLEWSEAYQRLSKRDRDDLLAFMRRLIGHPGDEILWYWKRVSQGKTLLISLEGIDGVLLAELAGRLAEQLPRARNAAAPHTEQDPLPVDVCWYDFDTPLWDFMITRFSPLTSDAYRAFERTLLFACERLHRQESRIRPLLAQGHSVVTPFFALAPKVYQAMEGLRDDTVIDAVERFLLQPDFVIGVESDPSLAAARAVPARPGTGEFYSPYRGVDAFQMASDLYHEQFSDGVKAAGACRKIFSFQSDLDALTSQIAEFIADAEAAARAL